MRIHLRDALIFPLLLTAEAKTWSGERELVARKSANATEVIPSPLVVPASQYCKVCSNL